MRHFSLVGVSEKILKPSRWSMNQTPSLPLNSESHLPSKRKARIVPVQSRLSTLLVMMRSLRIALLKSEGYCYLFLFVAFKFLLGVPSLKLRPSQRHAHESSLFKNLNQSLCEFRFIFMSSSGFHLLTLLATMRFLWIVLLRVLSLKLHPS